MHSVARHRTAPQGKARRFASRNLRRLPLLSPSNLSPTRRVPHALNKSCCGRESNLGLPSTADEGLGMPGSTHDCGKICFCLSQRLVHAKLEKIRQVTERRANPFPADKYSLSTLYLFLWKRVSFCLMAHPSFALAWFAVEPYSNLACTTCFEVS